MRPEDSTPAFPLRDAPDRDREIGMAYYASAARGTGGRIKERTDDFRVTEINDLELAPLDAKVSDYPHLVVRARLVGWDTFGFADRLSDKLGISRHRISWAGTKDKQAVTIQRFAIRGITPADLPTISDANLEAVGRLGRELHYGDLVGNTFEIRVRGAGDPARHSAVSTELRILGDDRVAVPNYFGPQRFGSRRAVTHRVGLDILRGDWEAAVMTYLGFTDPAEPSGTREFRQLVRETRDWKRCLSACPEPLGHERTILHGLTDADGPDRYRTALEQLPERLGQLFVHAAQSYVFNRILSERLSAGLPLHRATIGDIICFGERHEPLGTVPNPDRTQHVTDNRVEPVNRHIRNGRAWVTAPLVGTDSELAEGRPGELVRDVLTEIGLAQADFALPDPFSSRGTRRPMLAITSVGVQAEPLTFSFALPSGTYATTLLREYLKPDWPPTRGLGQEATEHTD